LPRQQQIKRKEGLARIYPVSYFKYALAVISLLYRKNKWQKAASRVKHRQQVNVTAIR